MLAIRSVFVSDFVLFVMLFVQSVLITKAKITDAIYVSYMLTKCLLKFCTTVKPLAYMLAILSVFDSGCVSGHLWLTVIYS